MNRVFLFLLFISLTFWFGSCCVCSNEEQTFSNQELIWIPQDSTGDSILYINQTGELKTFHIRRKEQFLSVVKCAGPCFCNCPEENTGYYDFELTGDQILNTLVHEGLTINLVKTNNVIHKTFSWSCLYGSFQEFDYTLDTLTVRNKMYREIYVKELEVCHIRKIFYCKLEGLIRFDYDDGTWERLN